MHNETCPKQPPRAPNELQIAQTFGPCPLPPPAMAQNGGQGFAGNVNAATQALLAKLDEDLPTVVRRAHTAAAPLQRRRCAAAPRCAGHCLLPPQPTAAPPTLSQVPEELVMQQFKQGGCNVDDDKQL